MPRARSGRAEKSLYHTRQLFVKRKFIQNIILPDPVICILLPIAFLMIFAYNNNCQEDIAQLVELGVSPEKVEYNRNTCLTVVIGSSPIILIQ